MDIKTKFSVGDTVWKASALAVQPTCSKCHGYDETGIVTYEPRVESFVIDEIYIFVDSPGAAEVSYIDNHFRLHEPEGTLFASEAEAREAAELEVRLIYESDKNNA